VITYREAVPTWRVPPRELALALVVTAAMCFDVGQSARPLLALPFVVIAGVSLAWRNVVPLVPLVLTLAVNVVLVATPADKYGPQTVIFGVLLAVFTASERLGGRRRWVGAGISLVGIWASHVVTADGTVFDFWPYLEWGVPWMAGQLVRRQTERAREAGARAALLEVEAGEAAARERERIARDLHDVIAHAVSLMVVQAGAERVALSGGEPRTVATLEAIEQTGRDALRELRAMLGVLGGSDGDDERRPAPDLGALPGLVDTVRQAGLEVALTCDVRSELAPGVGLVAYRVVQESLTNALRHGQGAAEVDVSEEGRELVVAVRNRVGRSQPGSGRGLAGMAERVSGFGGRLSAAPVGDSWVVEARIPLAAGAVA
jgi:signal transduction histidine kinase